MKTENIIVGGVVLLLAVLLFGPSPASAGTSIICKPDGTCDIVITQDDGNNSNGGWPKPLSW